MSAGDVYRHRKGALYRELMRFPAPHDLVPGDQLVAWADPEAVPHHAGAWKLIVTDRAASGETLVGYTRIHPRGDTPNHFARPARLFDDGRFRLLNPPSLGEA